MFEKYIETMKNNAINEAINAKDKALVYSKYYASIAFDQMKIYFDLGIKSGPIIERISLIKQEKSNTLEITDIPASIILFVDDFLRYKTSDDSLKYLVSNMKYYKKNRYHINLEKNDNDGISWTLYAQYTIRDRKYMICFYNLRTVYTRPNAKIYEELISAEIVDGDRMCLLDVTQLFKMYEGPNFDFNADIADITVSDILSTPKLYYDLISNIDNYEQYNVKINYCNEIERILNFDDYVKNYLVVSNIST